MSAIPLADAHDFAPAARRTLLVRAALLGLVAAAIAAGAFALRSPHSQTIVPLPANADTIIVLDLSASIGSDTYSRIGSTLSSLSRSHDHYGLVVFSGNAYEALPPGSPASDLAPLVHLFIPKQNAPGFAATYPRNPWSDTFSAGTEISTGLELAHAIATQGGARRPAVVLVSDLDDDPADVPRLASIVLAYRRDRIPLRVVGLNPSTRDSAFFRQLLGPAGSIVQSGVAVSGPQPRNHTPFPWLYVALAVAGAAALGAHELWTARLEWEPAQ
jgi:hypothetical protein